MSTNIWSVNIDWIGKVKFAYAVRKMIVQIATV